jgi:dihydrodipicolinate synthase/N-acetylneuraminate lyase
MVLPPDWAASCTPATFVEHYAAVAAEMPVMMVTGLFARRPMAQSIAIIEQVRDQAPGVVAVKDDVVGEFARRLSLAVYDQWAVISGGQKQNHLNVWPYGCDGYFSTFIKFKPAVAWEYWRAVEAKDLATARQVIRDYDMPLFDFIQGLPGSFDAAVHGIMELAGICGRWRRKPYYSLSDAEMETLAAFLKARCML